MEQLRIQKNLEKSLQKNRHFDCYWNEWTRMNFDFKGLKLKSELMLKRWQMTSAGMLSGVREISIKRLK